ncbi:hypothetical protein MMC07_008358 [Pseudocyphellaria aurata]|nr:hypothetical protein [Pseudocyphellaria aurata]
MEEPDGKSGSDVGLGNGPSANHSMINSEEVSQAHEAEQEDANEAAAESLSTNNTSRPLGFLSLPPELRKMIYRHLLVEDYPLSTSWPFSYSLHLPAIVDTCEQIRREAMQVMFAENTFFISSTHPTDSMLSDRYIRDTIQHVHFGAWLNHNPRLIKKNFIHLLREFGSPAPARGVLDIVFQADTHPPHDLLAWFATHLRRFTNFRTVKLEFLPHTDDVRAYDGSDLTYAQRQLCPLLCESFRRALAPVFGPAEPFGYHRGVRFHPRKYLDSIPRESDDWTDHLDGIRMD